MCTLNKFLLFQVKLMKTRANMSDLATEMMDEENSTLRNHQNTNLHEIVSFPSN